MSDDKQLERAGKKGLMAGLILGTIRRGNPNSSRLARPLAYGAGGYLTGTTLHLLAKRLIKPKATIEQATDTYMANHLLQQKNTGIQKTAGQVTDGAQAAGGAAVAAKLASGVSSRMLGYHNVYHGTSKANAESIKKEGLNPKRGGFGGAGRAVLRDRSFADARPDDAYVGAGRRTNVERANVPGVAAGC